jgi:hypothetical protein
LRKDDGAEVEGSRLKEFITNHYQNLFLSSAGHTMAKVLRPISQRITDEMNATLIKPFSQKKIWEALQSIGDLKAPRSNEIPSIFYKSFWPIVGEQVKKKRC